MLAAAATTTPRKPPFAVRHASQSTASTAASHRSSGSHPSGHDHVVVVELGKRPGLSVDDGRIEGEAIEADEEADEEDEALEGEAIEGEALGKALGEEGEPARRGDRYSATVTTAPLQQ